MILQENTAVRIRNGIYLSPTFSLPYDTLELRLVLARPILNTQRVVIKLISPEYGILVSGSMTGGQRLDKRGNELTEYSLQLRLTYWLGEEGRAFIQTARRDAQGYFDGVPLDTICRHVETSVYLLFESDSLTSTTILLFETISGSQPKIRTKNSVTFDAATSASEVTGDGVLSLTHTCGGSNRALFASTGAAGIGTTNSTSMSFAGVGMTEEAEHQIAGGAADPHAGYSLLNPSAAASQTLTSTLSNNETNRQFLACSSFTGVASIGNVQNTTATASPISVTVTGVGADDMSVDSVYGQINDPAAGANQTERNSVNIGSDWFKQSTQSGADGGVMSWTASFVDFWGLIAVNLVAASSGIPFDEPKVDLLSFPRPWDHDVTVYS